MLALSVMVSIMVVPARAVDPVTIAKAIESVLGLLETAESIARMRKELSDYFKGLTTLRLYVYCPNLMRSNISRLTWIWTSWI